MLVYLESCSHARRFAFGFFGSGFCFLLVVMLTALPQGWQRMDLDRNIPKGCSCLAVSPVVALPEEEEEEAGAAFAAGVAQLCHPLFIIFPSWGWFECCNSREVAQNQSLGTA